MGMRSTDVRRTGQFYLLRRWLEQMPHSQVALDDALDQGSLFINIERPEGSRMVPPRHAAGTSL